MTFRKLDTPLEIAVYKYLAQINKRQTAKQISVVLKIPEIQVKKALSKMMDKSILGCFVSDMSYTITSDSEMDSLLSNIKRSGY